MRHTFSQLITASKDYCTDDNTSSTNSLSSTDTFIKREINNTVSNLLTTFKDFKTLALPKTMSTVADQIYYHYPPGMNTIESATMTVSGTTWPLEVIHSQETWNVYQMNSVTSSTVPLFIFPRQYDFGIYPTPSDAFTVTLTGHYLPTNMTASDHTAGTIAIAQNAVAVTGTDTAFTSSMINRWLVPTGSSGQPNGSWYRISAYSSATAITLESYFEETSISGSTYLIGESPELPEELHPFIPYRVAGIYYLVRRKDPVKSQYFMNMYYTGDPANPRRDASVVGGVTGIIQEYKNKGSNNSQIVYVGRNQREDYNPFTEIEKTVVTT